MYYTVRKGRWNVRRIRYVGGSNRAPIAIAKCNITTTNTTTNKVINTNTEPPVTIQFDASDSYDPEDDPLTYHWDFGDGMKKRTNRESSDPNPMIEFDRRGRYEITLTVTDANTGFTNTNFMILQVGIPPKV